MMTQEEYCNSTNGKPWVNRAYGPDAFDCWGLVIDSFKRIDGTNLPEIGGYNDKDCDTGTAANEAISTGKFTPSQPTDGAIMTVFDRHGNIEHVGRCLAGRILHATKSMGVRWDSYQAFNRKYNNVRYFQFKG